MFNHFINTPKHEAELKKVTDRMIVAGFNLSDSNLHCLVMSANGINVGFDILNNWVFCVIHAKGARGFLEWKIGDDFEVKLLPAITLTKQIGLETIAELKSKEIV